MDIYAPYDTITSPPFPRTRKGSSFTSPYTPIPFSVCTLRQNFQLSTFNFRILNLDEERRKIYLCIGRSPGELGVYFGGILFCMDWMDDLLRLDEKDPVVYSLLSSA